MSVSKMGMGLIRITTRASAKLLARVGVKFPAKSLLFLRMNSVESTRSCIFEFIFLIRPSATGIIYHWIDIIKRLAVTLFGIGISKKLCQALIRKS